MRQPSDKSPLQPLASSWCDAKDTTDVPLFGSTSLFPAECQKRIPILSVTFSSAIHTLIVSEKGSSLSIFIFLDEVAFFAAISETSLFGFFNLIPHRKREILKNFSVNHNICFGINSLPMLLNNCRLFC